MRLNISEDPLTDVFMALAHPHRRLIVQRLASGDEPTVTDLAADFDVSFNQVSKHLKTLERAGLLKRRKQGREFKLQLDARPLLGARTWIDAYERFWRDSLRGLADYLDETKPKPRRGTR